MDGKNYIVNGYILAGGKGSRMGTDKGLLLFNGKPLVQKIIEQLRPVTGNAIIVSNNPEYEKFGLKVICDLIKDIGPAGGIYTALNHTTTAFNFIVSCDMPFISSPAIDYIIQRTNQSQITVPFLKGKTEPLFAVYSKDCLTKWEALIRKGINKLQTLINHFDTKLIDVNDNALFNDLIFTNMNTRGDFELAVKNKT